MMQPQIVLRERSIPGADNIIPIAPLQTLTTDLKPIQVDLSEYKKIGQNLNYEYYKLKNEKNI